MSEKNSFESMMDLAWTLLALYGIVWIFMIVVHMLAWFIVEVIPAIFSLLWVAVQFVWFAIGYYGRKTLRGLRYVWDHYI